MPDAEALFLTSDELADLATPAEYVTAVREGYRSHGRDGSAEPRTMLTNADPPGMVTGYLAILPDVAMGGYVYAGGFAGGDAHFFLPLFDVETGVPLALLDGASMNPYKTGATGAVAVDVLSRPDAETAAIIGSGAQARGQLRAIATVRDLRSVDVYSPTKAHREAFAGEMTEQLGAAVAAVASSDAAIEGADIVVTATNATEPVFDGERLEPGTHVTAMGQYNPDHREVDATTVARSTYVPDLRARVEIDAGAFIQARDEGAIDGDHIHAELGEIVAGEAPGRQSEGEITLFDSGGTGIETVAAGKLLYDKAKAADRGTPIHLAPASEALTGR